MRALGHDELALALAQRGEDELLAAGLQAVATGEGSVARLLRRCGDDAPRLWERVLSPLRGGDPLPALALATARPEPQWLTAVARWASSWLQRLPGLPLGILLPSWDRELAHVPHLEALLREGAIQVDEPTRDSSSGGAASAPSDAVTPDGARSAAERFLHGCLEARASTRGRFVLNQRLPATAAAPACEIDLAASDLRLAIELDGYHHFREPEDYRRDRRKDLALQRRGYWVLRFLSDDVVTHLEFILETIDAAMAARLTEGAPDR
ncbi:MAG: DUF559 domain-containing protein [Deltaproteobacteria bacterium]|nr:DUF559 domain-containing protein [Deltaproteobacteria bacterium]